MADEQIQTYRDEEKNEVNWGTESLAFWHTKETSFSTIF